MHQALLHSFVIVIADGVVGLVHDPVEVMTTVELVLLCDTVGHQSCRTLLHGHHLLLWLLDGAHVSTLASDWGPLWRQVVTPVGSHVRATSWAHVVALIGCWVSDVLDDFFGLCLYSFSLFLFKIFMSLYSLLEGGCLTVLSIWKFMIY